MPQVGTSQVIRFATFEVDLLAQELRKGGLRLKLSGQPFQVLAILLEHPGSVVSREEFQKRLWPDTFVDVDHNLNAAINKIREALGDSSENPRFVETLPRRGYRFVAPVSGVGSTSINASSVTVEWRWRKFVAAILFGALVLLAMSGWTLYEHKVHAPAIQRALTRLTFDDGLQTGATWSPDGRYIAYSSNRNGKSDIWVQQVSGGAAVQITKGPGDSWQPDWSPDGKYIAYRSEEGDGGIYIVPAFGGTGLQRKLASFGYSPHWSLDSSQILFQSRFPPFNRSYVVKLDGRPPSQILNEILKEHRVIYSVWHPDGKRVSAWIWDSADVPPPRFLTGSLEGTQTVESRFPSELQKQIESAAVGEGIAEWRMDFRFGWSPSGRAIYFERTFRGARNIWRMTVDSATLQATTVERLTTSPGLDAELSVSPDGRKVAFTNESQQIRAWSFPFDATHGRVKGPGRPVTSSGIEAWQMNLTRDGKKLAIWGNRGGQRGTWEISEPSSSEEPITLDTTYYYRDLPLWSPDGKRCAYLRARPLTGEALIVEWSSETRNEEAVATLGPPLGDATVWDWSPDGGSLLVSLPNKGNAEIWKLPLVARPHAERLAQRLVSDPTYNLYQAHYSLDGRWIVFLAVRYLPEGAESVIYVVSAAGGPWIRVTDGKQLDDKPRWSPDGKSIYFLSDHNGYFNVWGMRFDPTNSKVEGKPFQVTALQSRVLMIPRHVPTVEISLTQDRLIVPLAQVSGSIWMLDNVDR